MTNYKKIIPLALVLSVMVPGIASAHGNNKGSVKLQAKVEKSDGGRFFNIDKLLENEDGVKVREGNSRFRNTPGLFTTAEGNVTAVNGSVLTVVNGKNETFTINAQSAKVIKLPHTSVALSDVKVGDKVWVNGDKNGTVITASVVYTMNANTLPAKAAGTVTAVNGNNVTIQTKNNKTVTVAVDGNTEVVKANPGSTPTPATTADIKVGTEIKSTGLWDKVVKVFSAIKVKLF